VIGPLLTKKVHAILRAAARAGTPAVECSLDLDRSATTVELGAAEWTWQGERFPYLETCKDRTVYHWVGEAFQPVSRFTTSLIKLVPTEWGPPTFEIDGIKMLPTARVSPYADAERKVGLIQPRGKVILDTCGGLGYFAAWCLQGRASRVHSYEKNADIAAQIGALPGNSFDAILHDPPRFGTAGELYSQAFYDQLARVLKRNGKLFHYTGTPNKLTSGRNVPNEVAKRLQHAGFAAKLNGDGVLAVKK